MTDSPFPYLVHLYKIFTDLAVIIHSELISKLKSQAAGVFAANTALQAPDSVYVARGNYDRLVRISHQYGSYM